MTERILHEHRETWAHKPVLRAIYNDFYRRIAGAARPGRSLEIGGGSGNLKEFASSVVSTDIVHTPWLDAVADAQTLPFSDGSFNNIVAVDVLHHIERPKQFLFEARRVLQEGGRIILIEPAITPVSWIFYNFFHPEPVVLKADPLEDGPINPNRAPFDANQAIATLLIGRYQNRMKDLFPVLTIVRMKRLSFFAYRLSGGFRPWCLIPSVAIGALLRFENRISSLLGRLMAFRCFIVIEKAGHAARASRLGYPAR